MPLIPPPPYFKRRIVSPPIDVFIGKGIILLEEIESQEKQAGSLLYFLLTDLHELFLAEGAVFLKGLGMGRIFS